MAASSVLCVCDLAGVVPWPLVPSNIYENIRLFADWMGLSLLTQGSDKSQSGPLLSAMQSFGSGVQEGLTSLKTAVSSYNDTQSQAVLAAFNAEFCEEATYEAPSKKPLNFTGETFDLQLIYSLDAYLLLQLLAHAFGTPSIQHKLLLLWCLFAAQIC